MQRERRRNGGPEDWKPKVSIVTPVLDRASTIASCLASVAAQTYPHVEHIVVDGGSTDGTLDIVKSFSAASPLRWVTEKDEGMYEAINKGLAMAEGEVLAYLNSDDLYLPWSIETAVEQLSKGADLVYGDLGVLHVKGESRSRFFVQFYPRFDLRYYTHVASMGQPTVFWRRSVTDEIGDFDTDYRLIGDCEYWLRSAVSGKTLTHVAEILAIQIDHGETLRVTQRERLMEEFTRMRSRYAEFAGPPRRPKLERYKKSLRWRVSQWRFLGTAARKNPKTWPRFISFLKRYGIQINRLGTLVLFTLPGGFRPPSATWVDTAMFEKALLDEIGAPELGSLAPPAPE